MNEQQIEKYRKIYLHQKVPNHLSENGWNDLRIRLAAQDKIGQSPAFSRALAFFSLFLVVGFGTLAFIVQAKPGEPFYPLKVASDKFLGKQSPLPSPTPDNR